MLKLNKTIYMSLFVACFIVACEGGSGNGLENQVVPPQDTPESAPLTTPIKTVTVSTINLNAANVITAGQTFIINVKSNNGATATVNFANAVGTPNSVIYSPSTCKLVANGVCTSNVHVGLATPVTPESTSYVSSIVLENTNFTYHETSIHFEVTEPHLAVLSQPNPITITLGGSTSMDFGLADGSIPDETGSVTLNLSPMNGLGNFTLNPISCNITYAARRILDNSCMGVKATVGVSVGDTTIMAKAANNEFSHVITDIIKVDPGKEPTISIKSSLAERNIIAGHSFTLTASSINGASANLTFTPTDPRIEVTPQSCEVKSDGSCSVTAKVGIDLPAGLYTIDFSYQSGSVQLPINPGYSFEVKSPVLEVLNQPSFGAIRLNENFNAGFDIPQSSIPDGYGSVDVNVISSNVINQTCKITYANNIIQDNTCKNLEFRIAQEGEYTIKAQATNFTGAELPPIVVPNKFVYVLSTSQILMYGELTDGTLLAIHNQYPVSIKNVNQIIISPDGRFLYATKLGVNSVEYYTINSATGVLSLNPNVVATGAYPSSINISPDGKQAYVVNTLSNNISQYNIDIASGVLTPRPTPTINSPISPYAMVISPNGNNAYLTSNDYLYTKGISWFKIGKTGRLNFENYSSSVGIGPTYISIDPTASYLMWTVVGNLIDKGLYFRNLNKGQPSIKAYRILLPESTFGGLCFNPRLLPNKDSVSYLLTNNKLLITTLGAISGWLVNKTIEFSDSLQGTNTIAIDQGGKYLYIGHTTAKKISIFDTRIDSDGKATFIKTIETGEAPRGIVISPF